MSGNGIMIEPPPSPPPYFFVKENLFGTRELVFLGGFGVGDDDEWSGVEWDSCEGVVQEGE